MGHFQLQRLRRFFKRTYLSDIKNLYFRVLGNITTSAEHFDYVSGYANIDLANCGVKKSTGGDYDYGYVYVMNVSVHDKSSGADVNPISKAIWQFGRTRCPRIVNDQPVIEDPGDEVLQAYKAIINSMPSKNLLETFQGPNRVLCLKNFGKSIILNKSFIRLNCPTGFKLGGGSRVSKIEICDEWQTMISGNPKYTYGQEYIYTTQDDNNPNVLISSGVASYETGTWRG